MKFFVTIILLFVVGSMTLTAVSFPVERNAATTTATTTVEVSEASNEEAVTVPFSSAAGKSQLIALLLAGFVGALGIHRFYLGYTWQGVVQLLTLGACGIWSLIDFIRILTGSLQPKNGRYSKTL